VEMLAPYMSSYLRRENCPTYLWRRCVMRPRLISLPSTLTKTLLALHARLRLVRCAVVAVEVPVQVELLRAVQESVMDGHLSRWRAVLHQRQHPCCRPKALSRVQSAALTGEARQQRQTLSIPGQNSVVQDHCHQADHPHRDDLQHRADRPHRRPSSAGHLTHPGWKRAPLLLAVGLPLRACHMRGDERPGTVCNKDFCLCCEALSHLLSTGSLWAALSILSCSFFCSVSALDSFQQDTAAGRAQTMLGLIIGLEVLVLSGSCTVITSATVCRGTT